MTVPAFLVMDGKGHQFALGGFHLVLGLLLVPFLGSFLVGAVRRLNQALFGELASWHEAGFSAGRYFFAAGAFLFALYGAALLSVYFLVRSGLIKNPWE